jgi:nucleoside-diphosphate-sugar epimerase
VVGNLSEPEGVGALLEALRAQGVVQVAQVIVAVAPSRARGDDYGIYPAAAGGARLLATALGARQLLWVSSTGVYGEQDGRVVTEAMPLPTDREARVEALRLAEAHILEAVTDGIRPVVLRPAGLYGPGRDPAPRFRAGTGPLDRWCNFSWRDDVIAAVQHLLDHPPAGPATFNCTDDTPVEAWRIVQALTGSTPQPGSSGDSEASGGRSNQRVSSAALKATGWRPAVPSIFDGLERLGHALPGRAAVSGS